MGSLKGFGGYEIGFSESTKNNNLSPLQIFWDRSYLTLLPDINIKLF